LIPLVERFTQVKADSRPPRAAARPQFSHQRRDDRLDVERLALWKRTFRAERTGPPRRRRALPMTVSDRWPTCATELERSATGQGDPEQIARLTEELLKLCRSGQSPMNMMIGKGEFGVSAAA
jgi:hypothetical protein